MPEQAHALDEPEAAERWDCLTGAPNPVLAAFVTPRFDDEPFTDAEDAAGAQGRAMSLLGRTVSLDEAIREQ